MVDNPETLMEQDLFISESQEMLNTLAKISQRLGFADENQLEYGDIYSMYDTCRLDRARKPNTPSPWCVAFEEEDILVKYILTEL